MSVALFRLRRRRRLKVHLAEHHLRVLRPGGVLRVGIGIGDPAAKIVADDRRRAPRTPRRHDRVAQGFADTVIPDGRRELVGAFRLLALHRGRSARNALNSGLDSGGCVQVHQRDQMVLSAHTGRPASLNDVLRRALHRHVADHLIPRTVNRAARRNHVSVVRADIQSVAECALVQGDIRAPIVVVEAARFGANRQRVRRAECFP